MAVNESRSMNRDLIMGATDGKFKTIVPDRGGEVEMTSATMRGHELQMQYNIVERSELADLPTADYGRRRETGHY